MIRRLIAWFAAGKELRSHPAENECFGWLASCTCLLPEHTASIPHLCRCRGSWRDDGTIVAYPEINLAYSATPWFPWF